MSNLTGHAGSVPFLYNKGFSVHSPGGSGSLPIKISYYTFRRDLRISKYRFAVESNS